MNGYHNLESSSPPAAAANGTAAGGKGRRSLELTNTKETKAWEGLAIGAVTLARTFSTGSQRLCRSASQSQRRGSSCRRGGLPGALRRAFSMRRHPAGPGSSDGYWRIHDDMDGDSERGGGNDDDGTLEEHGEEAEAEAVVAQKDDEKKNQKKGEEDRREEAEAAPAAAGKEAEAGANDISMTKAKKKRGGGIFKACKKLLLRL